MAFMNSSLSTEATITERPRVVENVLYRYGVTVRECLLGGLSWLRYRTTQPLTIVVLGMHRSGTSCITRMVNLSGAFLGGPVVSANPSNRTGHWESVEGVAINDR